VLRGPEDPLPLTTRRILITGPSGAGKSTRPTFAAEVDQFTSGPSWVVEWQYPQVRSLLLSRADTLVWLNHGRWTVTQRVVRRIVRRRIHHVELWNGKARQASGPVVVRLVGQAQVDAWVRGPLRALAVSR
jgi:adenylate kinase family enzyme